MNKNASCLLNLLNQDKVINQRSAVFGVKLVEKQNEVSKIDKIYFYREFVARIMGLCKIFNNN